MATAYDTIRRALMRIGVGAEGEALSSETVADGLAALNNMLESWAATESLLLYSPKHYTYNIPVNTTTITVGPSGNINDTRPITISDAYVIVGTVSYPMQQMTSAQYANVPLKSTIVSWPSAMYYDPSYPVGNIYLTPVNGTPCTLHFDGQVPFTAIASQSDVLAFPPGYQRAIEYNLTIELSDLGFGMQPSPQTQRIAAMSKAMLKRANWQSPIMTSEATYLNDSDRYSVPYALIVGGLF